ncbi:MAG: hypothetical protein Q3999_03085 [Buchananella hordeovulneris]|nr:hypothetical protein [Buchananella hordeovulneris]
MRVTAGTTIMRLRAQGGASPFGDQTDAVISALSASLADAARVCIFVAAGFLVLGLIGAARLRSLSKS